MPSSAVDYSSPNWDKDTPKSERLKRCINSQIRNLRKYLEGNILTQIESSVTDREQREAQKSVYRRLISDAFQDKRRQIDSYIRSYQEHIKEIDHDTESPKESGSYFFDKSYVFEDDKAYGSESVVDKPKKK